MTWVDRTLRRPCRTTSARPSARSAHPVEIVGFDERAVQPLIDVAVPQPDHPAEAVAGQLATLDEVADRVRGHSQEPGGFTGGQPLGG